MVGERHQPVLMMGVYFLLPLLHTLVTGSLLCRRNAYTSDDIIVLLKL